MRGVGVGLIAHETHFTMDLLVEIMKQNNTYFVPMREMIRKNGMLPSAPSGLKIYRGKDKYKNLMSNSLLIIFTFSLHDEFIQELLNKSVSNRPKIIVLLSRSSLHDYENLNKIHKSELCSITFVSFWNSTLKSIDGCLGTGESVVKVFNKLNLDKTSNILLMGYGMTGYGIANYLNYENYYNVAVYDTDPVKLVIAQNSGLKTGNLQELAEFADVLIDATGDSKEYLNSDFLDLFYKKCVRIFSSSSKLYIKNKNGYVNKHGTVFNIDKSKGMCNMSYGVGGNSHYYMRVTGLTVLYFCVKCNNICDNIQKYFKAYNNNDDDSDKKNSSLCILNDLMEKKIANYMLKKSDTFGGHSKQYYSSKYLSVSELKNAVVGKTGIHASFSSPDRLHKIHYNVDGTFEIDTIENGLKLGTTTGTYKIVKKTNYDIGLIYVRYNRIFESSFEKSPFHRKHPNSVFKTMKNVLGPFIGRDVYEGAYSLNYSCSYYKSMVMTMHTRQ